jgi:hypothetical protein
METITVEIKCSKCKAVMGNVSGAVQERVDTEAEKAKGACPGGCAKKTKKGAK